MKRSVKNYLCISGMLIFLYAFGLTMVGTQEERSRQMEISQSETAATPVISYVLAGAEGAGFCALLGWYILSRRNERTFQEVCDTKNAGMQLSVSALSGCAAFALLALVFSGSILHISLPQFSMPEIQNPVSTAQPEEEPEEEPEEKPEEKTESGSPADTAAADQTAEGEPLELQNAQLAGTTPDSSVLATGKGGSLNLVSTNIAKSGDAQDPAAAWKSGLNSAILVRLGGSASILGSDVSTAAAGSAAVAVSGQDSSATVSDTTLHTTGSDSPAALAAHGGNLNLSSSTLLSQQSHSPALLADASGTITGSSLLSETSGPLSPAAEVFGSLSVSGFNANAMQSMAFWLHSGSSTELLSSTVSCQGAGSEGADGLFVLDGRNQDGKIEKKELSLTVNNSSVNFNPDSPLSLSAPVFLADQAKAVIACTGSVLSSDAGYLMQLNQSDVTLNLQGQSMYGRVNMDADSSLKIVMENGSVLGTSLNRDNSGAKVEVSLQSGCILALQSDCYLESLDNEDLTGSNIQTNGFTLYVGGTPWTPSSASTLQQPVQEQQP